GRPGGESARRPAGPLRSHDRGHGAAARPAIAHARRRDDPVNPRTDLVVARALPSLETSWGQLAGLRATTRSTNPNFDRSSSSTSKPSAEGGPSGSPQEI